MTINAIWKWSCAILGDLWHTLLVMAHLKSLSSRLDQSLLFALGQWCTVLSSFMLVFVEENCTSVQIYLVSPWKQVLILLFAIFKCFKIIIYVVCSSCFEWLLLWKLHCNNSHFLPSWNMNFVHSSYYIPWQTSGLELLTWVYVWPCILYELMYLCKQAAIVDGRARFLLQMCMMALLAMTTTV